MGESPQPLGGFVWCILQVVVDGVLCGGLVKGKLVFEAILTVGNGVAGWAKCDEVAGFVGASPTAWRGVVQVDCAFAKAQCASETIAPIDQTPNRSWDFVFCVKHVLCPLSHISGACASRAACRSSRPLTHMRTLVRKGAWHRLNQKTIARLFKGVWAGGAMVLLVAPAGATCTTSRHAVGERLHEQICGVTCPSCHAVAHGEACGKMNLQFLQQKPRLLLQKPPLGLCPDAPALFIIPTPQRPTTSPAGALVASFATVSHSPPWEGIGD